MDGRIYRREDHDRQQGVAAHARAARPDVDGVGKTLRIYLPAPFVSVVSSSHSADRFVDIAPFDDSPPKGFASHPLLSHAQRIRPKDLRFIRSLYHGIGKEKPLSHNSSRCRVKE